MKCRLRLFFLLAGFQILAFPLWGQTSASVQNFLPSVTTGPYWTVSGSRTLEKWRFDLGLVTNYSKKSLIDESTTPATVTVDDLLMLDFTAAAGLLDWLEVGIDLPYAVWNDITFGGPQENNRGLGDFRLEPKLRIVDMDEYDAGVAFIPFFLFPTGDSAHLLGNDGFAGGGRFAFDARFLKKAQLSLNVGFLIREGFTFPGTVTERDEAYLLGLGLNVAATDWMDIIAETQASILAKAPFDRESETPVEANGGFRFSLPWVEGLRIAVGGGGGLTFGYGSPDFRGVMGISYTRPVRKYVPPPPPPPEPEPLAILTPEKIEISKRIHFEFEKAVIRPVSYPILEAVAKIMKENPQVKKIQVEGHTDSKGSDQYNLRLSQKRAAAVRNYLLEQGVEPGRLTAKGFGETQPRDTNETDLGRARNRRVEFTILEQGEVIPGEPQQAPQQPAPSLAP